MSYTIYHEVSEQFQKNVKSETFDDSKWAGGQWKKVPSVYNNIEDFVISDGCVSFQCDGKQISIFGHIVIEET